MRAVKAKKNRIVSQNLLIVAVDIGKTVNVGYWRTINGVESKSFEFFNNGVGFKLFRSKISQAVADHKLEKTLTVLNLPVPMENH